MPYSSQSEKVRLDKNQFFSRYINTSATPSALISTFNTIDTRAKQQSNAYVTQNHMFIDAEFEQLSKVLKEYRDGHIQRHLQRNPQNQRADRAEEIYWLYLYYCAKLLEQFHKDYLQADMADKYKRKAEEIRDRYNAAIVEAAWNTTNQQFANNFFESIRSDLREVTGMDFRTTTMRNTIVFSNMIRILWIFNRLTITQVLTVANDAHLIEMFDKLLGTHTDVNAIIQALKIPTPLLNYLSVGIFVSRFLIDSAMLIKHACFPSHEEEVVQNEDGSSRALNETEKSEHFWIRFNYEFHKRHWRFINDIAWAAVNLYTNFPEITGVSNAVASGFIAAFLTFDVGMMFYKLYLDKQDYLLKKSRYQLEFDEYTNVLQHTDLNPYQRYLHIQLLKRQMDELDHKWKVDEATLYYLIGAAACLSIGFTSSLIVYSPILAIGSYYLGIIGVSLYMTYEKYSDYKDKSYRLEDIDVANGYRDLAQKEYEIAYNELLYSFTKNMLVPTIFITTVALYWPAAVLFTVVVVGAEVNHEYTKKQDTEAAQHFAETAPPSPTPR